MKREFAVRSDGHAQLTRRAAVRTGLVLASIAFVLFAGVIYAQYSGDPGAGVGVTGFAIITFLLLIVMHRSSSRDKRDHRRDEAGRQ
jgi:hypothetical protein